MPSGCCPTLRQGRRNHPRRQHGQGRTQQDKAINLLDRLEDDDLSVLAFLLDPNAPDLLRHSRVGAHGVEEFAPVLQAATFQRGIHGGSRPALGVEVAMFHYFPPSTSASPRRMPKRWQIARVVSQRCHFSVSTL